MSARALGLSVAVSMLAVCAVLVACARGSDVPAPAASPEGPPSIQARTIERHARQFDVDLPVRVAGSQEEFAAAAYITAHLQRAAYSVRLDAVPVEDTVRSSNLVAFPAADPDVLVTVGYDNAPDDEPSGGAIGAFLEMARALRVASPEANVAFVALGAQAADVDTGALGSRRLAKMLRDEEVDPEIVQILGVSESLVTEGPYADELQAIRCRRCRPNRGSLADGVPDDARDPSAPLEDAGFEPTLVSGPPEVIARVLLEFLVERSR